MEQLETSAGGEGTGMRRLARVYAESLLNVADKRNQIDSIGEELVTIVTEVFKADPRIELLLASRAVQRRAKDPILSRAFEGKMSDLLLDFLRVLNSKDRLDLIRHVAFAYRELCDNRAKRIRVIVRSAVALDEGQKDVLRNLLRNALHREPVLDNRVDSKLLGGLIVQVGDAVYDSSVFTRIETIRNQLLARSSHEIQVGRNRFSSDN